MQLKILSWNIWYDGHFDQISDFLRSSEADIIGLQEVVPNDPTRDVIGYLKKLGYDSLFAPALTLEDGRIVGNAIFSRHKILCNKTHILSEEKSRVALETDILVGNTTLHIFNLHLVHTHQQISETQNTQVGSLIRILPKDYTIVIGDFNAIPGTPVIQKIHEVMVDTDPTSTPTLHIDLFDCSGCDPKTVANTRLDYIFTSKDIKTHSFKVEHSNGSDHLPISVLFEI